MEVPVDVASAFVKIETMLAWEDPGVRIPSASAEIRQL